eukprot:3199377-Rhodomonas_salina.1
MQECALSVSCIGHPAPILSASLPLCLFASPFSPLLPQPPLPLLLAILPPALPRLPTPLGDSRAEAVLSLCANMCVCLCLSTHERKLSCAISPSAHKLSTHTCDGPITKDREDGTRAEKTKGTLGGNEKSVSEADAGDLEAGGESVGGLEANKGGPETHVVDPLVQVIHAPDILGWHVVVFPQGVHNLIDRMVVSDLASTPLPLF